jgi:hypothetical protein
VTSTPTTDAPSEKAAGKADRPIFIVGCQRSGTTLLRLMLHSHPRIALPPQTKFFRKLYKRRLRYGDLRREKNREKLAHWFRTHVNRNTKLKDLGIPAEKLARVVLQDGTSLGSAFGVIFREYARKWNKPRWGDKRPDYIKHLDVLLALFPDAQIIHIVRDGRDCLASLKGMPWWKWGTFGAVYQWIEAMDMAEQARHRLPEDQFYELRYEDLVADPEQELIKVCRFLEETYTPDMLRYQQLAAAAVPSYKIDWHYATHRPINSHRIGRWRRDLNSWEIALMQRFAGNYLRYWGYEAEAGARLPLSKNLGFRLYMIYRRLRRRLIKGLDRLLQRLYSGPLRCTL